MLFISQRRFTGQQKPLLLEQSDISLHRKGQDTSFCAQVADQAIPNKLQDAYITLVPASEVLCSATLKNGS